MYSSGSIMEQRDCAQETALQITHPLISMVISCTVCMESFLCLLLFCIEVINSTSDLLLTNTSVLTIDNINATQNGGVYECVVLNDAGFEVVQTTVYVRPVIVEQPQEIRTTNSTNVTLTCRAESFPYPRYQWQKYNTTAQSYQAVPEETGVDLMFTAQYNDFGDYRCMVTTPTINVVIHSDNATVHGKWACSISSNIIILSCDCSITIWFYNGYSFYYQQR